MFPVLHRDHPCSELLGREFPPVARGGRKDLDSNQDIGIGEKQLSYVSPYQLVSFGGESATVPCENCDGQGGFLDISDEDERGPIYDWFLCPQCQGTGEYEPNPRLVTLEDFEECFGWR